jgi:predicted O-linked N-acetylglucosamine transferase (SPINDLY family)
MIPPDQAFPLALQHHMAGRIGEAEAIYRQILAGNPRHAGALHFLGVVAHQVGRNEAAIELIRQSIAIDPGNFASHANLGEAYRALHRLDEAIARFRQALCLNPANAGTYYNMGNALKDLGRIDEAIDAYRRAIEIQPGFPVASVNLGTLLHQRGQFDEAIALYERALRMKSDYAPLLNNLGNSLLTLGRRAEAIEVYHRALRVAPDCAETHTNLGVALAGQGELDVALAEQRRSIELQPGYAMAHSNLGNALKDRGQIDEAVMAYRRAVELQPDNPGMHSNLIYALHFQPAQDERAIAEEHQRWNRKFSEPLSRAAMPHANSRNPERRLRLGYVSPDFRDHVVGRNLLPLFRCHHRTDFEIVCYSGVLQPDSVTGEFRDRADRWHHTVGMSDRTLAEAIRSDAIDILVDLTQHMAHNRLPVFAHRPAPVQVSFAGYPATTGLDAVRHRISDRWLEGEGRMQDASDKMQDDRERGVHPASCDLHPASRLHLLDSFWCYQPAEMDVPVNDLPAKANGYVTFGSFNNFCKINDRVLELWARLLERIPASCLLLLSPAGSHRQRALDFFGRKGIPPHRVEFLTPRPRREYLELYHRLDIVLDPFPYGGHTTSLDALWMGLPVVSLAGTQAVSRAGLSQLSNLGLHELVATSEDDYLTIATALAGDLSRLAELRRTLRARMTTSPLMNAWEFTRQIEAAYRTMWRDWCATPVS